MSWQNWAAAPGAVNANKISSTPSNAFNQFSATAGVNFQPTTRLVISGSYGRATQNDPFITDASTPVVPVASLNGLVVSTAFTARFTAKPAKKLNLTATYKYDNRDNQTPVFLYQFADANQPLPTAPNADFPAGPNNPLGALIAQNANANRPYSRQSNLFNAEADYAVGRGNWIKGGYDFERIGRSCPGSWIDCADAATTNENTLQGRVARACRGDPDHADQLRVLAAADAELQRKRVSRPRAVRQCEPHGRDRRRDRVVLHAGEWMERLGARARASALPPAT